GGAAIVIDAGSARVLAEAAAGDDLHAIGPYIAPVKLLPGGNVRPGNLRELIRRGGPTLQLPAPLESEAGPPPRTFTTPFIVGSLPSGSSTSAIRCRGGSPAS